MYTYAFFLCSMIKGCKIPIPLMPNEPREQSFVFSRFYLLRSSSKLFNFAWLKHHSAEIRFHWAGGIMTAMQGFSSGDHMGLVQVVRDSWSKVIRFRWMQVLATVTSAVVFRLQVLFAAICFFLVKLHFFNRLLICFPLILFSSTFMLPQWLLNLPTMYQWVAAAMQAVLGASNRSVFCQRTQQTEMKQVLNQPTLFL